ncbi:hypothetical protein OMP38_27280 [Cohnella ginsengisoli]|uniref:Uncharacterized protein n=1 Tax=Cohnella ginsengisoli TaxID=425004 RepID=A0A9X4QP97_9BACL|nr:hypothetical protein [Cohnella ginsengisoli]MDG0794119.1 hypothetical protein [Cohnella ginsengisoli]
MGTIASMRHSSTIRTSAAEKPAGSNAGAGTEKLRVTALDARQR